MLTQEIEVIRVNEPDRNLYISEKNGSKITDKFTRTFAQRNGLSKFITQNNEASLEYRRQNGAECDICCKMFTNEKNMRDHRKSIHFAFLK